MRLSTAFVSRLTASWTPCGVSCASPAAIIHKLSGLAAEHCLDVKHDEGHVHACRSSCELRLSAWSAHDGSRSVQLGTDVVSAAIIALGPLLPGSPSQGGCNRLQRHLQSWRGPGCGCPPWKHIMSSCYFSAAPCRLLTSCQHVHCNSLCTRSDAGLFSMLQTFKVSGVNL